DLFRSLLPCLDLLLGREHVKSMSGLYSRLKQLWRHLSEDQQEGHGTNDRCVFWGTEFPLEPGDLGHAWLDAPTKASCKGNGDNQGLFGRAAQGKKIGAGCGRHLEKRVYALRSYFVSSVPVAPNSRRTDVRAARAAKGGMLTVVP